MTHYPEHKHPTACIFGTLLTGTRNKANIQNKWVKIKGFHCEVTRCVSSCVSVAKGKYGFLDLYCSIGDSLSGKNGIIEPARAYSGPGLITGRKPVKARTHNVPFIANAHPAVCFYDSFECKQKMIGLTKIQITEK